MLSSKVIESEILIGRSKPDIVHNRDKRHDAPFDGSDKLQFAIFYSGLSSIGSRNSIVMCGCIGIKQAVQMNHEIPHMRVIDG